jgi:hypothetical protein
MTATYDVPNDLAGLDAEPEPEETAGQKARKPRKKAPTLHTDPIAGPQVLEEALTHLETLTAQTAAASGPEKRRLVIRRRIQQAWVEQLEGYHGEGDL